MTWVKCDSARFGVFECRLDPDPAGKGVKMSEFLGICNFGDFGGCAGQFGTFGQKSGVSPWGKYDSFRFGGLWHVYSIDPGGLVT